jgi:hypothetical protein
VGILILLFLLAVLGVTILRIRPLLDIHMFLGILLIVTLKLASTGYRFVRYYTSEPRYRRCSLVWCWASSRYPSSRPGCNLHH